MHGGVKRAMFVRYMQACRQAACNLHAAFNLESMVARVFSGGRPSACACLQAARQAGRDPQHACMLGA